MRTRFVSLLTAGLLALSTLVGAQSVTRNPYISGSGVPVGPIFAPDGSCTAGSVPYSFTNDTDTGRYREGSGLIQECLNGVAVFGLNGDSLGRQIKIHSGAAIGWTTGDSTGTFSENFYRNGAGDIRLGMSSIAGGVSFSINGATTGSPYLGLLQNGTSRAYLQYVHTGNTLDLVHQNTGLIQLKSGGNIFGVYGGGATYDAVVRKDGRLGFSSAAGVGTDLSTYFTEYSAGILGLNADGTHGVTLDVTTDAQAFLKSRTGGNASFKADTLYADAFSSKSNYGYIQANYADGQWKFLNNAGTAGVILDWGNTDAQLMCRTRAGADGCTLKALYTQATQYAYAGNGYGFVSTSGTGLMVRESGDGYVRLRDDAGTSFNLLQFGGTSSSFPALKRSGANIHIRKADDSGYGDLAAESLYVNGSSFMMRSLAAWSNGAAAQVGTLTNAPTAGNPTKWIPVDDNGTTRYIPAW